MRISEKQKPNWLKRTAVVGAVSLVLFFSPISVPKADAWQQFAAAAYKQMLEKIYDNVQGMIMGALKKTAATMLNTRVARMMGSPGGGQQAAFITDWQAFLIRDPENQTRIYMNDYLSQMTRGRNSMAGYRSEGFSGGRNYYAELSQGVSAIGSREIPRPTYEGDPSQMFSGGNFKNLNLYLSGVNNPWAFNIAYESEYQRKLEEQKFIQQAQAIAYQGVRGTTSPGSSLITNPGSLVKETVANIQNLPNNILAAAKYLPEVISSVVAGMVTQSIQKGFDSVQRNIDKSINEVDRQVVSGVNRAIEATGPAAQYIEGFNATSRGVEAMGRQGDAASVRRCQSAGGTCRPACNQNTEHTIGDVSYCPTNVYCCVRN